MPESTDSVRIAIVGPCAAGKTTLANALQSRGLDARQVVQEHSYVGNMWQLLASPDILIFLEASYEACTRRKHLDWGPDDHAEQLRRLAHARAHCDIYVRTDSLTPREVLARVLDGLGVGQSPGSEV